MVVDEISVKHKHFPLETSSLCRLGFDVFRLNVQAVGNDILDWCCFLYDKHISLDPDLKQLVMFSFLCICD